MNSNRRQTLIALGGLAATGGAVFSSAAFSASVNSSSDMRVVVDQELRVEPGILFRDGTAATDSFDPAAANSTFTGTLANQDTDSIFGGNQNNGMSSLGIEDLPAAALNDESNEALSFEVAVAIGAVGSIGSGSAGVFQVVNDTNESQDIAIRFNAFGPDVGNSSGQVDTSQVVETFTFHDSSGNQISTDDASTSPQTVDNTVTVLPGNTEQIFVQYDTQLHEGDIKDAAGLTGSPFNEQTDTVDLVDEISIGSEEASSPDIS